MPVILPLEFYEVYEARFGKEDAKKLVKSLEVAVDEATSRKWYEVDLVNG